MQFEDVTYFGQGVAIKEMKGGVVIGAHVFAEMFEGQAVQIT